MGCIIVLEWIDGSGCNTSHSLTPFQITGFIPRDLQFNVFTLMDVAPVQWIRPVIKSHLFACWFT